jgi:hypothetical protein
VFKGEYTDAKEEQGELVIYGQDIVTVEKGKDFFVRVKVEKDTKFKINASEREVEQ